MFAAPSALGIGWSYFPTSTRLNQTVCELVDFAEVSPVTLCREVQTESGPRLRVQPSLLDSALQTLDGLPVSVHGLELSIGSASGWNESYITMLDEFQAMKPFAWHSEHLGYLLIDQPDGERLNAGVPLPMPFTQEAVDLVAMRANLLVERYGVPFLLENAVYYFPDLPADPGWDEIVFLNRLVDSSDCGLLLDLFNLHCNSLNHGFDLLDALARLRLDRVAEVHVAGGKWVDGFILDGHCNAVPESVWTALEWLLPRAPNVAGVVYEALEPALPLIGEATVREQLHRLRATWSRFRSRPGPGNQAWPTWCSLPCRNIAGRPTHSGETFRRASAPGSSPFRRPPDSRSRATCSVGGGSSAYSWRRHLRWLPSPPKYGTN